jgi:Arc/MetJ-type ribon-helix-helix transcriptional regulator
VPEPLKQFIDGLVAEGALKDSSEYLGTLIERDRQAGEKSRLEALLIESLGSNDARRLGRDRMRRAAHRRRSLSKVSEEE